MEKNDTIFLSNLLQHVDFNLPRDVDIYITDPEVQNPRIILTCRPKMPPEGQSRLQNVALCLL